MVVRSEVTGEGGRGVKYDDGWTGPSVSFMLRQILDRINALSVSVW